MTTPEHNSPFDGSVESLVDRFDSEWQRGRPPDIADFLGPLSEQTISAGTDQRRLLLMELIAIDLEHRWKRDPSATPDDGPLPARPVLEDYCRVYPELREPRALPASLIAEEYRARQRWGDRPSQGEYADRFGAADLLDRLGEVDNQLVAEETQGPGTENNPAGLGVAQQTPPGSWPAIPGYEILGKLGGGGMGVVYRARQISLNRVVALKTILHGGQARAELAARFRREAEAVARLNHERIVRIHDFGEHEGVPYFTMEYLEGLDLSHKLQGTPLAARSAAGLVKELARTMHEVHTQGKVLHRDLKPSNIMLQGNPDAPLEECIPRITDFGLVKLLDSDIRHTPTEGILGTPSYMAPEQARGSAAGQIDARADVYALGAILYECLTGRPPFLGETPVDTVLQVLEQEPVPPCRLQPRVPRDLETICLKCLHKDARQRYPSAADLADDLERFLTGVPIRARAVTAGERVWRWGKRHPALAAAYLLGVLVIVFGGVGGGATWLWQRAERARQEAEGQKHRADQLRQQEEDARKRAESSRQEAQQAREDLEQVSYLRNVDLAHREWLAGNIARAIQLLQECPQERRRWEWHYVNRLCRSEVVSLEGHGHGVACVDFSPDGTQLASASHDRTAKLWDAETGRELRTFTGHEGPLTCVAFAPDGKRLATASMDGTARLWDVRTGKEILAIKPRPPGHLAPAPFLRPGQGNNPLFNPFLRRISGIAFSPDGKRLAGTPLSGGVVVWDTQTGKELLAMKNPTEPDKAFSSSLQNVAYSPDGKRLAAVDFGWQHNVIIWDANTGQHVQTLSGPEALVQHVAFSPDGKQLAGAAINHTGVVWDLATGKTRTLHGHGGPVKCICFSPDGRWIATGSEDRTVKVWDSATGLEVHSYKGHLHKVAWVVFSPDGTRLASAGTGSQLFAPQADRGEPGEIKIWNATARQGPLHVQEGGPAVMRLAFHPDGRHLAGASYDGTVKMWDAADGKEVLALSPGGQPDNHPAVPDGKPVVKVTTADGPVEAPAVSLKNEVLNLQFRSGGKHLAIASSTIHVQRGESTAAVAAHDLETGKAVGPPLELPRPGRTTFSSSVVFSSDARLLALAWADERRIRLWDLEQSREVMTIDCQRPFASVGRMAFSADGTKLAAGFIDGHVTAWEVKTARQVFDRKLTGQVGPLLFSPDGKQLAAAPMVPLEAGQVRIWELATGQEIHVLKGHQREVTALSYSPDGRRLAGAGGAIKIWDTITGREAITLQGTADFKTGGYVNDVAFSPDGERLAAAVAGTIMVWDIRQTPFRAAPRPRPEQAEPHYERGRLLVNAGDVDGAILAFREAVRLKPTHADAWNDLAEALRTKGLRAQAIEAYQELVRLKKADTGPDELDRKELGSILLELGSVYNQTRQWAEAETTYKEAISLLEKEPVPPDCQGTLAALWSNLAEVHKHRPGQNELVEPAFHKALALVEAMPEQERERAWIQRNLAMTHNNLGSWYRETGKLKQAETEYQKALTIRKRLAEENRYNAEFQRNLADGYSNLGNFHTQLQNWEQAEEAYEDEIEVRRRLAHQPDAALEDQNRLAVAFNRLGLFQRGKSRNNARAEASLKQALAHWEKLSKAHPNLHYLAVNLAGCHCNLGLSTEDLGNPEAALNWYAGAIQILEAVRAKEPGNTSASVYLRNSHWGRAAFLVRLDRHADSLADWDRAVELAAEPLRSGMRLSRALALARTGNHARAAGEAHALSQAKSPSGSTLYNLACVYALCSAAVRNDTQLSRKEQETLAGQYANRAVELLRKAQKAGHFEDAERIEHLKQDDDLKPLQAHQAFEDLLAELTAR